VEFNLPIEEGPFDDYDRQPAWRAGGPGTTTHTGLHRHCVVPGSANERASDLRSESVPVVLCVVTSFVLEAD
jgi:hypothetical protein